MSIRTVYVETTVIGHIAARIQADITVRLDNCRRKLGGSVESSSLSSYHKSLLKNVPPEVLSRHRNASN